MQDGGHIGQGEDNDQPVEHVAADAGSTRQQQAAPMIGDNLLDRRFGLGMRLFELLEHRRFFNAAANPQPKRDQHQTEKKRNAPAPCKESFVVHERRKAIDQAGPKKGAQRGSHLCPRGIESPLVLPSMLDRQQDCARPFAAESNTLHEAQRYQQQRRQYSGGAIGRQQADGRSR